MTSTIIPTITGPQLLTKHTHTHTHTQKHTHLPFSSFSLNEEGVLQNKTQGKCINNCSAARHAKQVPFKVCNHSLTLTVLQPFSLDPRHPHLCPTTKRNLRQKHLSIHPQHLPPRCTTICVSTPMGQSFKTCTIWAWVICLTSMPLISWSKSHSSNVLHRGLSRICLTCNCKEGGGERLQFVGNSLPLNIRLPSSLSSF